MLSFSYRYALLNDFRTVHDMLLLSHFQETIHSADIATQIMYVELAVVALDLHKGLEIRWVILNNSRRAR